MGTPHNSAKPGEIASTVFLPGDPCRAEWMTTYLREVRNVNKLRNMLAFTGVTPQGKEVSVMGSGMGMPSLGIYVHELAVNYGVKQIIRVGTAGSLREDLPCRSVVLALGACSDSGLNLGRFVLPLQFAPIADYGLLSEAIMVAHDLRTEVRVGNMFASDRFYEDTKKGFTPWKDRLETDPLKVMSRAGALFVEMETAELYTQAALLGFRALTINTVSDNLVTGEMIPPEERERSLKSMMDIALLLA
jgi:purine-nucleoside phosphorylase